MAKTKYLSAKEVRLRITNLAEDVDRAVFYFREYYQEKGIKENRIYPGIKELLESLSSESNLFIATSKLEKNATVVLDYFSITQYFKGIRGAQASGYRSGKSELVQRLIQKYNLTQSNQTVMVGDKRMDINAAKNCDIDSIGVTYGYGTSSELESCKPTCIVDSVEELHDILVKISVKTK